MRYQNAVDMNENFTGYLIDMFVNAYITSYNNDDVIKFNDENEE